MKTVNKPLISIDRDRLLYEWLLKSLDFILHLLHGLTFTLVKTSMARIIDIRLNDLSFHL